MNKLLSLAMKLVSDCGSDVAARQKQLLELAWNDGYLNYPEMISELWKWKISSKFLKDFDLKAILFDVEMIQEKFGTSFEIANNVAYGTTRSYVDNDILIELLAGMHKDILKGEVESSALS